jgi:hypothetical protein
VEKINYEIEYKIEFNETSLDILDFEISLLNEEFSTFSEIIGLATKKFEVLNNSMIVHSDGVGKLNSQYNAGQINLAKFSESLQKEVPELLALMREAISEDKQMLEYYGQAIEAAEKETSYFLDSIDSGISKLEHFKSMLTLIGKENNHEMVGEVLKAQYSSASDRLSSSTAWYNLMKTEYDALHDRWIKE